MLTRKVEERLCKCRSKYLTQHQQIQMKLFRDIPRQKRADGDFNSIIKNVNGVPKIVSLLYNIYKFKFKVYIM